MIFDILRLIQHYGRPPYTRQILAVPPRQVIGGQYNLMTGSELNKAVSTHPASPMMDMNTE
ncbi:hypothetical protein D3C81_2245840 [compost metagenome]